MRCNARESPLDALLINPDLIIGLATQMKELRAEQEQLKLEIQQQGQMIGELRPRANIFL